MRAAHSFLGLPPPPSSSSLSPDEARLRSRLKEIRVRFHPDRHPSASDEDVALNRHIVHMAEQAASQIMRGEGRSRAGDPSHDDDKRRRKQRAWDELEELIPSMRAYRSCDEGGVEEDRLAGEEEAERPSPSQRRRHPSPAGDCGT
jgi:hypothetical protein